MLHGIREGVIGFDTQGPGQPDQRRGPAAAAPRPGRDRRAARRALPPGRLRDVLAGAVEGGRPVVLTDDALLVVNRMPVDTRRPRRRHAW